MTIVKHELRQNFLAWLIWLCSVGGLLAICIFLFPQMKDQMESVSDVFASMGSFTKAFDMDQLNFGTLIGFYSVECGNILGLGGAFYASLTAVNMLSKEEKDRTAEFLLSHPISRKKIVADKLSGLWILITTFNLIIYGVSIGCIALIGEEIPLAALSWIYLAYYFMQLELAGICFGISAFLSRNGAGIGIGIAAMMYFLNLIANISESAEFLKPLTPFGYCEASQIIADLNLNWLYIGIGMAIMVVFIVIGFIQYSRKDIHS